MIHELKGNNSNSFILNGYHDSKSLHVMMSFN